MGSFLFNLEYGDRQTAPPTTTPTVLGPDGFAASKNRLEPRRRKPFPKQTVDRSFFSCIPDPPSPPFPPSRCSQFPPLTDIYCRRRRRRGGGGSAHPKRPLTFAPMHEAAVYSTGHGWHVRRKWRSGASIDWGKTRRRRGGRAPMNDTDALERGRAGIEATHSSVWDSPRSLALSIEQPSNYSPEPVVSDQKLHFLYRANLTPWTQGMIT